MPDLLSPLSPDTVTCLWQVATYEVAIGRAVSASEPLVPCINCDDDDGPEPDR